MCMSRSCLLHLLMKHECRDWAGSWCPCCDFDDGKHECGDWAGGAELCLIILSYGHGLALVKGSLSIHHHTCISQVRAVSNNAGRTVRCCNQRFFGEDDYKHLLDLELIVQTACSGIGTCPIALEIVCRVCLHVSMPTMWRRGTKQQFQGDTHSRQLYAN